MISIPILDRRPVRWAFAVLIGAPLTLFTLFFAPIGAIVGGSVIAGPSAHLFAAALITSSVLGALGVVGGWLWLIRLSREMSRAYRFSTAFLLGCGVVAAAVLCVWAIRAGWYAGAVLPAMALLLGLLLLLHILSATSESVA